MNNEALIKLLGKIADVIEENKQYLTELDAAIGDADHGVNMARGFEAVKNDLDSYRELDCGNILVSVGKTLVKVVAGSAGALYGSGFKALGKSVGEGDLCYEKLVAGFEAGIEKIAMLGGAKEGEKTMLDAMYPALRALKASPNKKEGFAVALHDAEAAKENTKNYVATKGRASYVGERSIGHIDPGAASFCLILKTVAEFTE